MEVTRRDWPTPIPRSLRDRLNGNLWPLAFALLFGGGGATAGAWSLVRGEKSPEVAALEAKVAEHEREWRHGMERRLDKLEESQGRVWRVVSGLGRKFKVAGSEEDEP